MGVPAAQISRIGLAIAVAVSGAVASAQAMFTHSLERELSAPVPAPFAGTPSAQAAAAQAAVQRRDFKTAIAMSRRSLSLMPLSPGTLRTLALARIASEDTVGAGRALTLASQLGWRDADTQKFLLQVAIRSGDAKAAAIRLDALARQQVDAPRLKQEMRDILLLPGGPGALAERLAENPKWRTEYLQATDALPASSYPAWLALLGALERSGAPLRPTEYSVFERTLITKGEVPLAITASRKFGALQSPPPPGFGVIAQGQDVSPFVWSVEPGREAAVSQAARGSLSVSVDGQAGGELVRRVFPLAPGPHRLALRLAEKSVDADRALQWKVTCLPSGMTLDTTVDGHTNAGVQIEEHLFTVPAGCPAVRVALATASGQIPQQYQLSLSEFSLD